MKVGIIGYGFVGKALANGIKDQNNIFKVDPKLGTSISDLVEVCYEFKQNNNNLRLATKYPNIVRRKLEEFGVTNVVLVTASGGLEAAPMIGYADIIADITVTGTTMKENNLRPLLDGVLFDSQAAFISSNNIPSKLKKTSEQIIKKINL